MTCALLIVCNKITGNGKQEMWNSRGGPRGMVPSFTHRISTAQMSGNGNINISNEKQSCNENIGISMSNKSCNIYSDPCNRTTETINACIPGNLCNSGMKHRIIVSCVV